MRLRPRIAAEWHQLAALTPFFAAGLVVIGAGLTLLDPAFFGGVETQTLVSGGLSATALLIIFGGHLLQSKAIKEADREADTIILRDNEHWPCADPAETVWAQATMPYKGRGHLMGWRGWGLSYHPTYGWVLSSCATRLPPDHPPNWPPQQPAIGVDIDAYMERDGAYRIVRGPPPGLYAYKEWNDLEKAQSSTLQRLPVVGQVALWGRVVEHAIGYRARYAYPVQLYLASWARDNPLELAQLRSELETKYGVPVSIYMDGAIYVDGAI